MKIGDAVECAIWLDGRETPGHVAQWKTGSIYLLARSAGERVLKLSPVEYEIKYPGEDRVPAVPDHVSGPNVRLLIASATVIGFEPIAAADTFLAELDKRDRARLRRVTRLAHARNNPGARRLTDEMCDAIIERLGPVAAAAAIRDGVDSRTVH